MVKDKKKKQIASQWYNKGVFADDKQKIIDLINQDMGIELLQQQIYDDKTQSVSVKIYFKAT